MPRIRDALARYLPRQLMSLTREQKASAAGPLIAFQSMGRPVWAPRDYAAFAREGFMQNAIVYRSVRMIAETAASIPILLYDGDHEIANHPLLDLMRQPSRDQTTADMLESWFGFLLVSGNAYAEAVAVGQEVREIHILRPDRMKVVPGADGWPEGYEYTVAGQTVRFGDEALSGLRPILHVKMFHPDNDHYGMSPIEAAGAAIDIHNEATNWNKALLDNAARPSGALVYAARDGHLTGEQYERLKAELEDGFQGAKHAGRPLLLEGGLDWRPLSLSPKDMDFIQAKHAAAREIALALGVPPMLLGIPGDNTYSNYQEANRSFWRHTVLPLVNRTLSAFSGWLGPVCGGGLTLKANRDEIEALTGEIDQLWARLEGVSFLTPDEKRAAAGYGPLQRSDTGGDDDGPEGKRFNADQPRVPAGDPDGGQTLRDHVGRSDAQLLRRMYRERIQAPSHTIARKRVGIFASKESAIKLINSTLVRNAAIVKEVAAGRTTRAFVKSTFVTPTGREAFARTHRQKPVVRVTYGVGVSLAHDEGVPRGFRIITAYPRSD